jgi:hypothetical protein
MSIDALLPIPSRIAVWSTPSDTPHLVGLLWTSDQLVAWTSTLKHTTLNNRQTSLPSAGFEPTITADERPLGPTIFGGYYLIKLPSYTPVRLLVFLHILYVSKGHWILI